jgi:hypothetical protein
MRQAIVLGLAVLTTSCASPADDLSRYSVVTGRIISTTNLARFIGDVAEEAYSYAIEPENAPGTRVVAISGIENACVKTGVGAQVYVITLVRARMAFGLTDESQRALLSDQYIMFCVPKARP